MKNLVLIVLAALIVGAFYEPLLWFAAIGFLVVLPPQLDPVARCKEWTDRK